MSEEARTVEVEVDWSSEGDVVYANGAHLTHSQREFAIAFTEFAAFEGRGSADGSRTPRARVTASVRVPPDVFLQFAAACASNWNKYADEFGGPSAPRFQLVQPTAEE
jgi:hypothetical protein